MMQWLASVETSGLATWVRESNSIWAYPTILTLHTVGLGLLVGANWALDLRLLGIGSNIPLAPLRRLFPAMWIGFWLNALTGVLLFTTEATTKGTTTIFIVKLGLVAIAVAVMKMTEWSVYGRGSMVAAVTGTAKALAVLSVVIWIAAIAMGRFMAYAV
jgi:hypothetical protein